MTQLSVNITGADIVRQGLQDLGAEIPQIGQLQIYQTMQAIVRTMKVYPPPPPASTYVWTGMLGAGWMITPAGGAMAGYTAQNNTPYTKYVVGNAYGLEQAWMHQGRWQLFRDVADEEVGKLPPAIEENISMVARREGF